MTAGRFAGVDPEAWRVIDGKLYLSYSKRAIADFSENAEKNIAQANQNWKRLALSP